MTRCPSLFVAAFAILAGPCWCRIDTLRFLFSEVLNLGRRRIGLRVRPVFLWRDWESRWISGCGSPAARVAAERALEAGGLVVSIIPPDEMPSPDWPATVVIPCGMGDARHLMMALAGDACIVIGGRAGTISEGCLAWLHKRPLLPLVGCGGWSDLLPSNPPDERQNSVILPWSSTDELEAGIRSLGLVAPKKL